MKEWGTSAAKTQKLVTPAFLVRGPILVFLLFFNGLNEESLGPRMRGDDYF